MVRVRRTLDGHGPADMLDRRRNPSPLPRVHRPARCCLSPWARRSCARWQVPAFGRHRAEESIGQASALSPEPPLDQRRTCLLGLTRTPPTMPRPPGMQPCRTGWPGPSWEPGVRKPSGPRGTHGRLARPNPLGGTPRGGTGRNLAGPTGSVILSLQSPVPSFRTARSRITASRAPVKPYSDKPVYR